MKTEVILGVVYAIGKANEKWASFGEFFIEVIGSIVGAIYGILSAIDSLTFGLTNFAGGFDSNTEDLQAELFYNLGSSLEEIKNPFTAGKEAYNSGVESVRGIFDDLKSLTDINLNFDETLSLDGYNTDLLEYIASDTSDISNTLKDLNDEVKYLNDIAESKYIKNYNSSVRGINFMNLWEIFMDNIDLATFIGIIITFLTGVIGIFKIFFDNKTKFKDLSEEHKDIKSALSEEGTLGGKQKEIENLLREDILKERLDYLYIEKVAEKKLKLISKLQGLISKKQLMILYLNN